MSLQHLHLVQNFECIHLPRALHLDHLGEGRERQEERREGGREGGKEGGKEGGREGWREREGGGKEEGRE